MSAANFTNCLTIVLRLEGGYVDDPRDPGGATNRGITRRTLAYWRGVSPWQALSKDEVKDLGGIETSAIYRALYWRRCAGSALPVGLDLAVFDFAVNSGPTRAVSALQSLLGVAVDGAFGPLTLEAVRTAEKAGEVRALIARLCATRLGFLKRLATFTTFGRGWTRRVDTIQHLALAMRPAAETFPSRKGKSPMNILSGYKTYIVGIFMIVSALAQIAGVHLPGFDSQNAGQLIMQAFAIIFLRQGLKTDTGNG